MLTSDERDLLFKILNDVKILPLDPNALPLLQAIQSIAKKIFAATGGVSTPSGGRAEEKPLDDF